MIRSAFFVALTALFAFSSANQATAQKYFTRDGKVSFDATAKTSPEKINGFTKNGTLVLDKSTGNIQMAVLLKGFLFEKALMQEHFNENYLETSKFPKAEFNGKLDNPGAVDLTKDGTYSCNVTGNMTMHGVTKPVTAPVTFTVKGGQISAASKFSLPLADYNVDIPSLVADKIAKQATIQVTAALAPLNK
jgi:polyisoprenoid-binding protein YceI